MRRALRRPRALLLPASLVTALAVIGGVALVPDPEPVVVAMTLTADPDTDATTPVGGAALRIRPPEDGAPGGTAAQGRGQLGRPVVTSRSEVRQAVSSLRKLTYPAYRVEPAGAALEKLPPPPPEPPAPVPGASFTFQIGTLNVLGSQHRGNGTGRAAMLAGAITGRGVDVVGLQEVQRDQLAVLRSRLPGYTIWPGLGLGNQGVRLQIAFRNDLFELAGTGSISTTFDHQRRPIPWVRLRYRPTGAEFHVIDIHNSPRDQEADRDAATGAEIGLVQALRATGTPVFVVGDMNEHTEFFCRVSAATGMVGSNGATTSGGGCRTGAGPIKIDWVMGGGGVSFSGHAVDYAPPIRTATDHAFVHATTTVTPLVVPGD